jgi:hypothetical protein
VHPKKKVGSWLFDISCSSSTFCAATNHYPGDVLTYDGSSWVHAATLNSDLSDVSCVSEAMCVAVGDHSAFVFDGVNWTSTRITPPHPTSSRLLSVSCASEQFCAAVDSSGRAYRYNGTSWTKPTRVIPLKPKRGSASVSCGAIGECALVASHGFRPNGYALAGFGSTLTGGNWSTPERIDPAGHGVLTSVSCPSATFCIAVDDRGYAITYRA